MPSAIKDIEKVTNHDSGLLGFFKKSSTQLGLRGHSEFIHFGRYLSDINNTAFPLSIKMQ